MAKLGISTGTTPNDGTGDTLLQGAIKVNSNFNEIYTIFGDGNSLKNIWNYTFVGISTLSNVGVGTTNPTSALTVKGNTSLETLNVSGFSTFRNNIDLYNGGFYLKTNTDEDIFSISYDTNNDDITFYYKQSGGTGGSQVIWYIPETSSFAIRNPAVSEAIAEFTTGGSVALYYDGSKKFETIGSGVTVTGTTFTDNLRVGTGGTTITTNSAGSIGIGTTNPTSKLSVIGNTFLETLNVSGVSTFSMPIYEKVSNDFSTTLTPSSGKLTIPATSPILVGTLGSTVTTWSFTGIDTSSSRSVTVSLIIDSNSLYSYGDLCEVNNSAISGGVRWPGGIAPLATNNEDILTFTIITDGAGTTRVYGSSTLNYS